MISLLKGRPLDSDAETVTVDVNGVGYEVHCSLNTLAEVAGKTDAVLWIYTHVREDAIVLCGFASRSEKQLFQSLIKVTGIGPRMALKILSGAPLDRIIQMIEERDAQGLSKLPKVGKKTAEQMILTLKGKLEFSGTSSAPIGPRAEIVSGLVNLGFRLVDVERAVGQMGDTSNVEEGIKKGLAALSQI
ncbi:MAG: Holliday junction branch migration protein RuvA [Bdellovibrionia bacterium]